MIWCDHMLNPFMDFSSCHSMPLNALAPCLNLCSILQHMVSLRWPSSHSHQPIPTSLEVRTCHLSKSWSLLHNNMLCAITGETHKCYLEKTVVICVRRRQAGSEQHKDLKPVKETIASHTVGKFDVVVSLQNIKSCIKPLFGVNMCLRKKSLFIEW